jgi:hypothetical protein
MVIRPLAGAGDPKASVLSSHLGGRCAHRGTQWHGMSGPELGTFGLTRHSRLSVRARVAFRCTGLSRRIRVIRACHDARGIAGTYVESRIVVRVTVGPGRARRRRGCSDTPRVDSKQRSSGPGPVSRDLKPLTSQTDRPEPNSRPGARQVALMCQRRVVVKGTLPCAAVRLRSYSGPQWVCTGSVLWYWTDRCTTPASFSNSMLQLRAAAIESTFLSFLCRSKHASDSRWCSPQPLHTLSRY